MISYFSRLLKREKRRQMAFTKFRSLSCFRFLTFLFLLMEFFPITQSKILLLYDETASTWNTAFGQGLSEYQTASGKTADYQAVPFKNETHWDQVCQMITGGVTAVVDLTQRMGDPETQPQKYFISKSVPYFKIHTPLDALIKGVDVMLQAKNASNGFLIFPNELDANRGIHVMLGTTLIRYAFLNSAEQEKLILEKFDYRVPSAVIMFGNFAQFSTFIKKNYAVVRNRTEWVFMFDSFRETMPANKLNVSFPFLRGFLDESLCCLTTNPPSATPCNAQNCAVNPTEMYLKRLAYIFSEAINDVDSTGTKKVTLSCDANDRRAGEIGFTQTLTDALNKRNGGFFEAKDRRIQLKTALKFEDFVNGTGIAVGEYTVSNGFTQSDSYQFRQRRRYFRIGIVDYKPWTFKEDDKWTGYCIDLAKGISDKMDFDYDLIESNGFGKRQEGSGRWDGLTGDLVHGKIDIAVAAYIMTSEREEFIDFVSPYYEQSGLIITMKRPVVKNSLFKFMTVLRTEVWLSIAGATVATGFMLWFLDKFSPYSAQNNPHKYKNFRKFTLKESFWFALTSFTPQGGGEPPKAFSGRTLVAAYWIFVVLMLATFTANLAAFLTVERMQSPIRNLEHLAAQSSVKYSVVNTSTAMTFFRNMAHAEETLYQMWRNLTLKAPSSAREYVVWEYPIREQYIHIHSVIQKTGALVNHTEGFQNAMNDDYFAFIHDAAQTRYEVYRNCNLTIIGEPFAEAPYAIAVAQGNPLQDDISMAILQLQTARFFESLSAKYWTSQCPSIGEGESDGISLQSLGGVFIATIIGLGIAFISLAFEVFTTARNRRKAKIEAENMIKPKFIGPMDFYGASKGATQTQKSDAFRRAQFLPEVIN